MVLLLGYSKIGGDDYTDTHAQSMTHKNMWHMAQTAGIRESSWQKVHGDRTFWGWAFFEKVENMWVFSLGRIKCISICFKSKRSFVTVSACYFAYTAIILILV